MSNVETPKDPTLCAAYGCPCAGSISTSTSGTNEWLCWQHHSADRSSWQRVSAEMNRLLFVVEAVKSLREAGGASIERARILTTAVNTSLRQHQRSDLRYSHADDKTLYRWLLRLDNVLAAAARECSAKPQAEKSDSWKKLNFELPVGEPIAEPA